MGEKLNYPLRLCQVVEHASLPHVRKTLPDVPKRQQLTTLKPMFDNTAQCLRVCAPIVATPSIFNTTLALGFRINYMDNPKTGIHESYLGKNTYSARKVLKDHVDQHQVIAGDSGAPTLTDVA